ncbi:metalloproteinase inhibitor 2-like [Actinia tenebrosa]|uniref:Metalloproteinase inhibitor 2-like n=1 Tax=Actinia tenebrosa TaxID=6105 RepID=A0A6P8I2D3_ACTTE|nr:metalloproteinase inhibitor 2-like [Actinia tenebrosa]
MDFRASMAVVFIVIVVFFSFADGRSGRRCKCRSVTHPQEFFCRSDYVFRGKLLSGPTPVSLPEPKTPKSTFRIWATERKVLRYVFQVDEILKGQTQNGLEGKIVGAGSYREIKSPYKVNVYTDPHICTVELSSKTHYVVGGYLDERRMFVSSCDWVSRWNSLSRAQKVGFRHRYGGTNCECYESSCSYLDPEGVLLDSYCRDKHLYCGRQGLGCNWKHVFASHIPYNKCVVNNIHGLFFDFAQNRK